MEKKVILLSFIILIGFAPKNCLAKYSGGDGSEANPYRISNAYDMNDIGLHDEDWDKHFVMVNDVNLAQFTGTQFNLIGKWIDWNHPDNKPFTGVFDGNDFAISNFTYNSTGIDRIGLFRYIRGASSEIRNLGLIDPNVDAGTRGRIGSLVGRLDYGIINNCYVEGGQITGNEEAGGLVGTTYRGEISNCYSMASVTSTDDIAGGLVGLNVGNITNCYSTGNVVGDDYVGGLVGENYRTISNSYSTGSVEGHHRVGGLVGYNDYATISDCYATGSVFGTPWWSSEGIGGLVGENYGSEISNSYSTGSVEGNNYVGGLVGRNYALIENCYAIGSVTGHEHVGGLVGDNTGGTISDCNAAGNVNGGSYTGGLVGVNTEGTISDCNAAGAVDGRENTGGLVGENTEGTISDSYATGNVNGGRFSFATGGLVGSNHALIENCYATGTVSGFLSNGGLVGLNYDRISNSYATGAVDGREHTGGLVGFNFLSTSIINNCYATGTVSGFVDTGGLVGRSWGYLFENCYAAGSISGNRFTGGLVGRSEGEGTIYTKCFWDSDINPGLNGIGDTTDPNVIGKSTAQMQTESTFTNAGWDFVGETANGSDDIWKMCYMPDYPHLWWEQCPRPSLEMPMHFTPRMLNPKSKGKWVKAHFILPEGFTAEDVNTNSPAKIVEPFMADSNYMDVFLNKDGLVEIMAAFDRAVFCSNGSMLEDIVVIARLTTGQYFYGTDTIRIKTNNLGYLAVLTSYWLAGDCVEPDWCAGADLNRDSVVDFIDFAFFDGCCLEFIKN